MADQLNHIELYLRGELSEEEIADFEALLKEDVSLKKQVENHRQFLKGVDISFNRELKQMLVDVESNIEDVPLRKTKRFKAIYPLMGMAAAIASLIIVFFTFQDDKISSESLYAQYYKVYPNAESPVLRSTNNEDNPFAYYEKREYASALELFNKMQASDPENSALLFYSAMCQLELDHPETGIELFDLVISREDPDYKRPALWYQSLAYLKIANIKESRAILEHLNKGDDLYARKADDLLKNLD